jgi:hypothetical protein
MMFGFLRRGFGNSLARRLSAALITVALPIVIAACGGGSENTDEPEQSTQAAAPASTSATSPAATTDSNITNSLRAPTPTALPPTQVPPRFAGYDFEFSEGDFWRFRWECTDRSYAQGSGCKTTEDDGVFQMALGESTVVNGVTLFMVLSTGRPEYVDNNVPHSFAPEWQYI